MHISVNVDNCIQPVTTTTTEYKTVPSSPQTSSCPFLVNPLPLILSPGNIWFAHCHYSFVVSGISQKQNHYSMSGFFHTANTLCIFYFKFILETGSHSVTQVEVQCRDDGSLQLWTSVLKWSSHLSLSSSWDDRPAPPCLAKFFISEKGGGRVSISWPCYPPTSASQSAILSFCVLL